MIVSISMSMYCILNIKLSIIFIVIVIIILICWLFSWLVLTTHYHDVYSLAVTLRLLSLWAESECDCERLRARQLERLWFPLSLTVLVWQAKTALTKSLLLNLQQHKQNNTNSVGESIYKKNWTWSLPTQHCNPDV